MSNNYDSKKEVEEILGKPFTGDFTEQAHKVRLNLFAVAAVTVFITLGNMKLASDFEFFGLKFSNLPESYINASLLILNAYLFSHYLWYAAEAFMEWRIRLTGTRVAFQTGAVWATESGDYPENPRQSTLYNWWLTVNKRIKNNREIYQNIEKSFNDLKLHLEHLEKDINYQVTMAPYSHQLAQIHNEIHELKGSIDKSEEFIGSQRIPASLERFDNWLYYILNIQSIRWLFIEIAFPLCIGLFAIVLVA